MFGLYFAIFCAALQLSLAANCGQEGYTYPDTKNCHNYYICRNDNPILMQCPPLLYWNCHNSTCSRMRQSACCPNDNSLKILGINIPCINEMKIPDLTTCNRYYLCVNNTYQPYYCPIGQKFSTVMMRCKTAMFGACATPRTTTTKTTTTRPTTTGTTGTAGTGTGTTGFPLNGFTIPNIFNCNQYYTYQNYSLQTVTCPNKQYYNCWQRNCTNTRSPLCCTSMPYLGSSASCPTNGVTNSIPLSCFRYYECINNKVTVQSCQSGQAFDAWTSTCMNPLKARCSIKPGLTVCQAGMNGAIPFGSVNFNISVTCPKWRSMLLY